MKKLVIKNFLIIGMCLVPLSLFGQVRKTREITKQVSPVDGNKTIGQKTSTQPTLETATAILSKVSDALVQEKVLARLSQVVRELTVTVITFITTVAASMTSEEKAAIANAFARIRPPIGATPEALERWSHEAQISLDSLMDQLQAATDKDPAIRAKRDAARDAVFNHISQDLKVLLQQVLETIKKEFSK